METIKKKMATLRQTLDDAESRANAAEDELKKANDRADAVSRVVMFKSCLHVLPFTKALLPRNVFRVFSVLFLSMYILLSWKTRLWFCENSAVCFDASEPKGRPLSSSPKCFVIFSCVDALFEMISFRPKKKSLP